ncbi:MAG: FG-GAP repeat protein, partial [Planctomycetes bacterium]|nr:FG-GAP repeat protein [Planctomycetota bacterium]
MALSIDTMIRLLVRSAFVLAAPSLATAFAPQSGISTVPFWTYEGDQAFGYVGWSVADAGDVNGDGFDDVLVG